MKAQDLLARLDAHITLGLRIPVKVQGLKKLATMGKIGERILQKAIETIEVTKPKDEYKPLLDLVITERAIAEQCFPNAPRTVPEYMQEPPEWLKTETILQPTTA